jgi:hypothetical protein
MVEETFVVQMVLDDENMREVFQLLFSALANADSKDAKIYAVDLLQELLKHPHLQQILEQWVDIF